MKLSKRKLNRIIQEEYNRLLQEQEGSGFYQEEEETTSADPAFYQQAEEEPWGMSLAPAVPVEASAAPVVQQRSGATTPARGKRRAIAAAKPTIQREEDFEVKYDKRGQVLNPTYGRAYSKDEIMGLERNHPHRKAFRRQFRKALKRRKQPEFVFERLDTIIQEEYNRMLQEREMKGLERIKLN